MEQQSLEIPPFRVGQVYWMIRAGAEVLKQACRLLRIPDGACDNLSEKVLVDIGK